MRAMNVHNAEISLPMTPAMGGAADGGETVLCWIEHVSQCNFVQKAL